MKNLVLVLIIGIAIGMILYPTLFPPPDIVVPPPVLVPGKPDTVYVEKTEKVPVSVPTKPDTVYLNDEPVIYDVADTTVSLFDNRVDIKVRARALEIDYLEIIGLKFLETVITQVDTLHVPYGVPIDPVWYRSLQAGVIYGIIFTLSILWVWSKVYSL